MVIVSTGHSENQSTGKQAAAWVEHPHDKGGAALMETVPKVTIVCSHGKGPDCQI